MGGHWSRRSVLAAVGGVGAVGGTVAVPTAAARLRRKMVIPAAEDFAGDEGYTGYFVHVGDESETDDVGPNDVAGCEFPDWPPEGIQAFNGTLLDRIQEDHRQVPTKVYAAKRATVSTGSLWVINRIRNCPGEHVGLEVEQVGAAFGNVSEDATSTETSTNPIGQPGFGPVAGVAATLTGAAALVRRLGTDE